MADPSCGSHVVALAPSSDGQHVFRLDGLTVYELGTEVGLSETFDISAFDRVARLYAGAFDRVDASVLIDVEFDDDRSPGVWQGTQSAIDVRQRRNEPDHRRLGEQLARIRAVLIEQGIGLRVVCVRAFRVVFEDSRIAENGQ